MTSSTKNSPEVQMDRRRNNRRDDIEDGTEVAEATSTEAAPERRKVQRRRQIDPTTCERDYTNDEIEFMQALDDYKRSSGRMFPTCSEILEVVRDLGYVRLFDAAGNPVHPWAVEPETSADEQTTTVDGVADELAAEATD